jgi:predicted O-methyltransferase YrrM
MKHASQLALGTWTLLALVASTAPAQPPGGPGGRPGDGPGPGQAGRLNPFVRLFDANGDGTLTQDEIQGAAAKLKEFDASKDGKLTAEELRRAMPMPPGGPGFGGRGPGFGGRGRGGPPATEYENTPLPKDDQEKKILAAIEEILEGPRFANVSTGDGRLLRLLTEVADAKTVVEIGTSTGHSAVWFALALRSTGGHLYTHEIDPDRAKVAEENFKKAGVDDVITVVLGDAHETVKRYKEPIDVLFLDADKEGYLDYLGKLLPLVRPGGLVIAHNMRYPNPNPDYIKAITTNPKLETTFLLMEGAGVGVTLKKR